MFGEELIFEELIRLTALLPLKEEAAVKVLDESCLSDQFLCFHFSYCKSWREILIFSSGQLPKIVRI